MCCNYCYHFTECKKAKKTDSDCCSDCAEHEFCPFIIEDADDKNFDKSYIDEDADIDVFEGDEF